MISTKVVYFIIIDGYNTYIRFWHYLATAWIKNI